MVIEKGMVLGHLTVVGQSESSACGSIRWVCRCVCGNETEVRATHLRGGHTRSCGCRGRPNDGRTKTYNAWSAMRQRCTNPQLPTWGRYGGRGIKVSPLWDSFDRFLQDVGPAPSPSHSLDRINPDGDYEPGNVRWATPSGQARNRTNTRHLTFKGETHCLQEWAAIVGITPGALGHRLKAGWDLEQAMTTPPVHRRRNPRSLKRAIALAEAHVAAARVSLQEAEQRLGALLGSK